MKYLHGLITGDAFTVNPGLVLLRLGCISGVVIMKYGLLLHSRKHCSDDCRDHGSPKPNAKGCKYPADNAEGDCAPQDEPPGSTRVMMLRDLFSLGCIFWDSIRTDLTEKFPIVFALLIQALVLWISCRHATPTLEAEVDHALWASVCVCIQPPAAGWTLFLRS